MIGREIGRAAHRPGPKAPTTSVTSASTASSRYSDFRDAGRGQRSQPIASGPTMNSALMFAEYQASAVAPRRCAGMLPVTTSAAIPIAVQSGCRSSDCAPSSWTTSVMWSSSMRRPCTVTTMLAVSAPVALR